MRNRGAMGSGEVRPIMQDGSGPALSLRLSENAFDKRVLKTS